MQRSKIEWCDFSINPIKGKCPMACSYCYARRLYDRFHWNPEVRFDAKAWSDYLLIPDGSKVFVGSTMELFGPWAAPHILKGIIQCCEMRSRVTWIFLTKNPQNLPKEWPDNCWVGVSAVDTLHFWAGCHHLAAIKARVKFFSFEPLQESLQGYSRIEEHLENAGVKWVIVGQQTPTKPTTTPKVEWVKEIVDGADKTGANVFLKNNLVDTISEHDQFFDYTGKLRQEFPLTVNLKTRGRVSS